MFVVHVHCSLFMFIVHCSHGATLIFDDVFLISYKRVIRDVAKKKRENVGIFHKWGTPPPPCLGMTRL